MKKEEQEIVGNILLEYGAYLATNYSNKKPDVIFIKRFCTDSPKEFFEFRIGLTKKKLIAPLGKAVCTMVYTSEPFDEHKYFKNLNYNDEYLLFDNMREIFKGIDELRKEDENHKDNRPKHKWREDL